ncbi:hypothetical protein [Candidatus Chromulinivorax destructor]|uniref:Uncharacterized protein n=1 Tax=Candidatus Chromulinivorax destructor TaxID=2066483 RepID=A0A345ZAR1_9BACT|nr:hypothetical protein [Candidatus Chromulinivorax destructor]AXK60378.1 hypothetical protein C0J27_01255 [Candidatus Chromulinivorax destructor]
MICSSQELFSHYDFNHNPKNEIDFELPALIFGVGAPIAVTILGLTSYFISSYMTPESFYVKSKYPYAQVWYDEMIIKYPDAHLKEVPFLFEKRGVFDNYVSCYGCLECTYNQICCYRGDLEIINNIYKKKAEGIELTENDINNSRILEFILLNVAGYLQQNSYAKRLMCEAAVFPAAVAALALYKNNFPTYSLNIEVSIAMWACLAVCLYNARYQAIQANKFACSQAADIKILQSGLQYFNNLTKAGVVSLKHPQTQVQAQMIADEIVRRSSQD